MSKSPERHCNCVYCRTQASRAYWKSKRNKHGRPYGSHVKGGRSLKRGKPMG